MKKVSEILKRHIVLPVILLLLIVVSGSLGAGEFLGVMFAWGYGGNVPGGGMSTPPVLTAYNYPMTINIFQEGTLIRNVGEFRMEVKAPKGSVEKPTTFNTNINPASFDLMPNSLTGAAIIGSRIFEIKATDANGKSVRDFREEIQITFNFASLPSADNLGLYWLDETLGQWVLVSGAKFDTANSRVIANIKHLTKFAVIKAKNTPFVIRVNDDLPTIKGVEVPKFPNGTLIRKVGTKATYVIKSGKKVKIKTLKELRRYYFGKKINKISSTEMTKY